MRGQWWWGGGRGLSVLHRISKMGAKLLQTDIGRGMKGQEQGAYKGRGVFLGSLLPFEILPKEQECKEKFRCQVVYILAYLDYKLGL